MFRHLFAILPLVAQAAVAAPWPNYSDPGECRSPETKTVFVLNATVDMNDEPAQTFVVDIHPETNGGHESTEMVDVVTTTTTSGSTSPHDSSIKTVLAESDPVTMATSAGGPVLSMPAHGSSMKTVPAGSEATTMVTSSRGSAPSMSPSMDVDKPKASPTGATSRRNVLYYMNSDIYEKHYLPQDILADEITHVMYAFADIATNGSVVSSDLLADVQKPLGDSTSGPSDHAFECSFKTVGTEDGRQVFASSAVGLLADWGFDGLEIDWEFPANEKDAQDFVKLLQACRGALDRYAADNDQDYHYLLTVAGSAGPDKYNVQDLKGMDQYLDAWHLMAYDYAGSWDKTSGNTANLHPDESNMNSTKFNTDQAVKHYTDIGIAPGKMILGLPLYGRSFENTAGLGEVYDGIGPGTFGLNDGQWLHNSLPQIAKLKAKYLLEKGLGGTFFWEASGDKKGEESIVSAMSKSLGTLEKSQNMLHYPKSVYQNIKSSMDTS